MDNFRTLLAKKPEDSIALELEELITNEVLLTMLPNLPKMASIALALPVSTDSVERSFSLMKSKHDYETLSLKAGSLS